MNKFPEPVGAFPVGALPHHQLLAELLLAGAGTLFDIDKGANCPYGRGTVEDSRFKLFEFMPQAVPSLLAFLNWTSPLPRSCFWLWIPVPECKLRIVGGGLLPPLPGRSMVG